MNKIINPEEVNTEVKKLILEKLAEYKIADLADDNITTIIK